MSEVEERNFFEILKTKIRVDQIVIATSCRFNSGAHGDHVILLEKNATVWCGSQKEFYNHVTNSVRARANAAKNF